MARPIIPSSPTDFFSISAASTTTAPTSAFISPSDPTPMKAEVGAVVVDAAEMEKKSVGEEGIIGLAI